MLKEMIIMQLNIIFKLEKYYPKIIQFLKLV